MENRYRNPVHGGVNKLVFAQKRGILVEIKARKKFYRRRPERSALGVHMVDILSIKF
jgi:hypothetical protein